MNQKRHKLKIAPKWFDQVLNNEKSAELRTMDRPFEINDLINLQEYENGEYTGREILVLITGIITAEEVPEFLKSGKGMISFKRM